MIFKSEFMSANTHPIVIKLKYDVNGYCAPLWFTSDDFLKKFRWPDENILECHASFIRPSKLVQKVIRSEYVTI